MKSLSTQQLLHQLKENTSTNRNYKCTYFNKKKKSSSNFLATKHLDYIDDDIHFKRAKSEEMFSNFCAYSLKNTDPT